MFTFQTHDRPLPDAAVDTVDQGIGDFNDASAPLHEVQPMAVFVHDASGVCVGGAVGRRWGSCGELSQLWVHEAERGQGLGTQLMDRFEAHARALGCAGIALVTYSFQAPKFYAARGYVHEYTRTDFPHGITQHHMLKKL
jgi:GNAT superfamily N-acetyltransferase